MNNINNFDWVVKELYNSILLELYYKGISGLVYYAPFEVAEIKDVTGEDINVAFANIDDITKLLTMSMIRFNVNIMNGKDIIDIPFRKIYNLYLNSGNILINKDGNDISLSELEAFSICDGKVISENYYLRIHLINEMSDELVELLKIANDFGNMGMQEKFDALSRVNMINYKKINSDTKYNNK